MANNTIPQATLTTIAVFPEKYFLENLIVRADNSVLVTAMNRKELWYVPPADQHPVRPELLHTFEQMTMSLVEIEPNVFYLFTSNVYSDHKSSLHRIDLRNWSVGEPIRPVKILDFPEQAIALNGGCLVAPRTIVVADSGASLIWRVDVAENGESASARTWLRHESMGNYPGQMKPEQPGANGIRYAPKLGYIYYTATAKKVFMRVKVDPATCEAVGEPEHVDAGRMADDFCIDEDAGVAYVTTHRENTLDCVSLNPAKNSNRFIVAGDPLNEELVGPSSAAWSRKPGEYGRIAFVLTDGGTASPLPDGFRTAKLLRAELPGAPEALREALHK